jgi:hypothetical protein
MSSSNSLIASLAQDRHAERYRSVNRGRDRGWVVSEARALESTRTRAGWLLVGIGLRLVAPGGKAAARRARLIGQ